MQSSTRTWQIKNVLCILILCTKSTYLITKINQIEPMKGAYIELHCTAFSKSLESLRVEKQRERKSSCSNYKQEKRLNFEQYFPNHD